MEKFKRKKEEDEKVRLEEAYEEFRETFEEGVVKVSKTFIRGDIVNANQKVTPDKSNNGQPTIYKPSLIIQNKNLKTTPNLEMAKKIAEEAAKKIMKEAASIPNKNEKDRTTKSASTKKAAEKSTRLTNLEAFKEELKQMQAMRDERKGLRQQLKEKLGVPEEELNRIAPALDTPYGGTVGAPSNTETDLSTTNLYVCNLPADTKIEDFFETFGSFGPLASAKILYPKDNEERFRVTLSGFVAFMSRIDAERALCAMHGEILRSCELRVSWAKPVIIPPLPFYVPPPLRELAMPDPPSGLPFNAKPLTDDLRTFLQKYTDLPKLNTTIHAAAADDDEEMAKDYKKMVENATVRVVIPTERPLLHLIHRVVEFLIRSGPLLEAVLMARERQNPMFRFLFDNHHPTHVFVYYRWRLYSVLQGDDRQKWRLDRFRMFDGGSWWQPPPHALFELGMPIQLYDTAYVPTKKRRAAGRMGKMRSRHSSGESDEENEEEREKRKKRALLEDMEREERQRKMKGILNEKERQELEELLRNLTPEKTAIGDAMIWCLDHAECSKEIALCIFESLCIKETPLHKKIARIFLISDILANCSARVKDAFYFRQHLGDHLQKIFIQLNETLESIESRLKAEQFRQRVMLCFRNWEDHALYPTQDLIQWQNIFLGLLKNSADDSSLDGEPMPMEDELVDEELDGIPLAEDEDLDGVPMGDEEWQQQQNMDEADLDGVPMDDSESSIANKTTADDDNRFTTESWSTVVESADEIISKKEEKTDTAAAANPTKSKWESLETSSRWADHQTTTNISSAFLEEDLDENDAPTMKRQKLSKLSPSPEKEEIEKKKQKREEKEVGGGHAHDDEERRKILREIEMKVVKFQDELEADGAKSQAQIQTELAKYRQKLMAKIEEKTATTGKKESNGKQKRREKSPQPTKEEQSRRNESSSRRGSDHHSSRRKEEVSSRYSRESDRRDGGRHRSRDGRNERSSERRRRRSRSRSGRR